jgi:8-oxo-dGTP diphosphatase
MRHTNNEIKTPLLTVDIIIRYQGGIVLIERKNPPPGWALPGGFVDVGESLEEAAIREAKEETSLDVTLIKQFHAYSKPRRDPRFHTVTMVFIADGEGTLKGRDDARKAEIFTGENLPDQIAFDHGQIIADYFEYLKTGKKSGPK